jgi:uncharacterized protein
MAVPMPSRGRDRLAARAVVGSRRGAQTVRQRLMGALAGGARRALLSTADRIRGYYADFYEPYGLTSQQYNVLPILRASKRHRVLHRAARTPYLDRMRPTVDDIRRTVAIPMARRGVVRAGIFGSFARGEATASSDIDFLVEFEKGRTLVDLSGLRLDLCEVLGRDVDVATLASLHPKLRDRILRELVPIL